MRLVCRKLHNIHTAYSRVTNSSYNNNYTAASTAEMSYTIDTNLAPDQIPGDFLSNTSDFLCALFNRPKKVIMGQLRAGQTFDFSGSADPCAVINLTRGSPKPGAVTDEAIERYVAAISGHVRNTLGIPESRLMIFYHEHDLALIGNDGRTLKKIWSEIGTFPSD